VFARLSPVISPPVSCRKEQSLCDLHSTQHTALLHDQQVQHLLTRPVKNYKMVRCHLFTRRRNLKPKPAHNSACTNGGTLSEPVVSSPLSHPTNSPEAHNLSQLYPLHIPRPIKCPELFMSQQHTASASCIQSTLTSYKEPRSTFPQPALSTPHPTSNKVPKTLHVPASYCTAVVFSSL
jgi:hypothetical protein